ncbi:MAG: hypothetical protein IKP66_08905 [Lachnospiraceae bacterium]|nr:hypothetical protein [Lachnospiraceae bacterium]
MRSDNLKFNDIFWNTLGMLTYAAVSLLISVVIINISGSIEGGIFSFGFSTLGRLVYIVSYFGMRPMHIVDIKYRHSFYDYISFGLKSATLALVAGLLFILIRYMTGNYTIAKSTLLIVLVLHAVIDGFSDYYECEYQRVNKLSLCGQSVFFRITTFSLTLIIVVYVTKNLLLAEIAAIVVEIVAFYILNVKRSKGVFKSAKLNETSNKSLFIEALPLFLVTFLDMYIFSAAKFAIDLNLGDVYSGFFNLVFMPTNVIYLVMTLFMKPLLTPLSNAYHNDRVEYNKILLNTFLLSLGLSLAFIAGTLLLGNVYLSIVKGITAGVYNNVGKEIIFYNFTLEFAVLFIAILGGCFYTICTPMYFAVIIEDKQRYLLISYGINAIVSFFISRWFVSIAGIIGAVISFLISMFLLFVGVLIVKGVTA